MKVQCDVCAAEAASVFCCADEAVLCDGCDHRVHRANKLAEKHHRFSLLHPSSSSALPPPTCDICQEKRGFLFCKEDRAVLCRDCDVPIHTASSLTMKHTRFLLTGVRISPAPISSSPDEAEEAGTNSANNTECRSTTTTATASSSISDYLIKMLPGWHVEDLLVDDATTTAAAPMGAAANGFYQVGNQPISLSSQAQLFHEVIGPKEGKAAQEQAGWERWVPQMQDEYKSRPSPFYM